MEQTRKFKIIVNSKECGTCSGPTPSAVAKKVVKKLCGTSSKVVKFSLKECKRGCERVCGPYQGRMEKLDNPYTRSGKKITHRVVCGKVRKMRGGNLELNEFLYSKYVEKNMDSPNFKVSVIHLSESTSFTDVFFFLGEITIDDTKYYKYILQTDSDSFIISTPKSIITHENKKLIDYNTIVIYPDILNNKKSMLSDNLIYEIKKLEEKEIKKFVMLFDREYKSGNMYEKFTKLVKFLMEFR